jgi:xanthosine utilization system XapX-like protein
MKLPDNTMLIIQGIVSIAFGIIFFLLIVFSHNPDAITASIAGIVGIYLHWTSSPAQDSTINALVKQLTPAVLSLLSQPQPTQAQATPVQPAATTDITQSMKAIPKENAA